MQTQNQMPCDVCHGHKILSIGGGVHKCPMCDGTGNVQLTPARIPVWYNIPTTAIAANATFPFSLQINQNADFEWVFTVAKYTSSNLNVTMSDGATGRLITQSQNTQNAAGVGVIPIDLFAGTAQLPFPLLEPYIFARATTVQFYFTDTSGATNTLSFALIGFQLVPQNATEQGSAGMIVDNSGHQRQQMAMQARGNRW